MRAALLPLLPLLASATYLPSGEVTVSVGGLRSAKGQVMACLTAVPHAFPDCRDDPLARKLAVAAREATSLRFAALPAGTYAVSLFHDENGNGRIDMALIVPREGYGFSRDAPVRMGPPKFARAAFAVDGGAVAMTIKMRYLL